MKRNLSRMFRTGVAAAAALLCAMPFQAAAEDYPSRPITLIMPFGAGNAPDTAARIIGDYLQRKHNITLLITSKPGGSGIPATLETVRARPDGYTISLTSANVLTVVPQYKKCGFTYKDLAPVAQVNVFTMGWGVRADSGIASVQDLMDKAKAERGKYSLASPGAFTAQRFYHANVMKLFPESDLPYVAYNGGAEIVTALLGNHISAGFTPVVNFKPHKDIRVIAVSGARIWVENHVDFSQNRNLIVAAVTLILGAGDFSLSIGGFTIGGIGTATFGAILLNALMTPGERMGQKKNS